MAPTATVFTPISDVLNGQCRSGTRINVTGIVTDFRTPIATRGEDYKCQVRFYDESTQDEDSESLSLTIFRKLNAMPSPACGDAIVIFGAKVQVYQSDFSLMTNWTTDVYVFSASSIPRPPDGASEALRAVEKEPARALTATDYCHVSSFYHRVSKAKLPTATEFQIKVTQSAEIKNKFRLLRDIAPSQFVDVIAEVVKEPYDMGNKFTLWISDYTEHPNFYNFSIKGLPSDGQSNPYNYTVGDNSASGDWSGPYGKHSIQITCFEPHTEGIRSQNISAGSWVLVRNLHIKFGRNNNNLEGYLREDRQVNISLMDHLDDGDLMDVRLKDTIKRRRDYDNQRKKQLKAVSEAAKAGMKRRAALEDDGKPRKSNAKSRRSERRQANKNSTDTEPKLADKQLTSSKPDSSTTPKIKLNSTIKCENEKQPVSSLAEVLETINFETLVGTESVKLPLPFINANFRVHVRVKDYLPHRLEDFAFAKVKKSIYDALSDDERAGSSSDDQDETLDQYIDTTRISGWEWRFYLHLEDAETSGERNTKESLWVAVDNAAAQCLLNMNASDLRNSRTTVSRLREKLFYLWGDLEEQKTKKLRQTELGEKQAKANRPPVDSDDDEVASGKIDHTQKLADAASPTPANRPFACCIKQYGVPLRETDYLKADAGERQRWQRMYGLFGTQIAASEDAKTE